LSRVLIIDDDRDLLNVCGVGLHAFGHEVMTAGTGRDGLDEAPGPAPAAVLALIPAKAEPLAWCSDTDAMARQPPNSIAITAGMATPWRTLPAILPKV